MARRRKQSTTPLAAGAGGRSVAERAVATSAPANPWILERWSDLALFVGTPLLILPAFLLARQQWSIQEIALFVAAFGALGHHFPGMLRAYGDPDLFRRFRVRFIAAPIFLAVVCAFFFALRDWGGMVLVAALWGVWHGMMQTYGFGRIYDAKLKVFDPLTRHLDLALSVAWFGVGLFLSPTRSFDILNRFYARVGGPILPPSLFEGLRGFWAAGTALVTVLFLVHFFRQRRRGKPASWIKLLLFATSFGFWIYCSLTVKNLLVGVALFEIFHDVQYLSITWIYNRNRVEKDGSLGGLTRFLFRRSGALIGLYVGLVFAYGSLAFVAKGLPIEPLMGGLQGILVASALLHFYYDGFIWKVREKSTRESLGLEGGQEGVLRQEKLPRWASHGSKWLLFAVPVVLLGVWEASPDRRPKIEIARALAESIPRSAGAQHYLGVVLAEEGRRSEAEAAQQRALELRPEFAEPYNALALLAAERGDLRREVDYLRRAVELDPTYAEAHGNLGVALASGGDLVAAMRHYRLALEHDPELASAHNNLGLALAQRGDFAEAIGHLERALELRPDNEAIERALESVRRAAASRGT